MSFETATINLHNGNVTAKQQNSQNNSKFNNNNSIQNANARHCFNNNQRHIHNRKNYNNLNHSFNTTTTNNHYHFNIYKSRHHHHAISQRKRKDFVTDTIDHILNPNKRQRIENQAPFDRLQSINSNKNSSTQNDINYSISNDTNINTDMQKDYISSSINIRITNGSFAMLMRSSKIVKVIKFIETKNKWQVKLLCHDHVSKYQCVPEFNLKILDEYTAKSLLQITKRTEELQSMIHQPFNSIINQDIESNSISKEQYDEKSLILNGPSISDNSLLKREREKLREKMLKKLKAQKATILWLIDNHLMKLTQWLYNEGLTMEHLQHISNEHIKGFCDVYGWEIALKLQEAVKKLKNNSNQYDQDIEDDINNDTHYEKFAFYDDEEEKNNNNEGSDASQYKNNQMRSHINLGLEDFVNFIQTNESNDTLLLDETNQNYSGNADDNDDDEDDGINID